MQKKRVENNNILQTLKKNILLKFLPARQQTRLFYFILTFLTRTPLQKDRKFALLGEELYQKN
jgi:hypothetical protein